MPSPLHVPRINNNDDTVRVVRLLAGPGDRVQQGEVVAEIETDKSVMEVEVDRDGFVVKIVGTTGEEIAVGSVLMWIGESADELIPLQSAEQRLSWVGGAEPTAKARALLTKYGLRADEVPSAGNRLSAADIEAFVLGRASREGPTPPAAIPMSAQPEAEGMLRPLSAEERGMLNTVSWHRDQAAAAYLEIQYDPQPWEQVAADYAAAHKLMMSPLLPLMAHHLARLARETPRINSTIVDGQLYQYGHVNLGFTMQAGETLYLIVVQDADALPPDAFLQRMGEIQRRAMGKRLRPEESRGATVAFSSMARWNVGRHIPILPPHTSLIVAHAAPRGGTSILGASYDHRVLSGADVVKLLQSLSKP